MAAATATVHRESTQPPTSRSARTMAETGGAVRASVRASVMATSMTQAPVPVRHP